MIINDLVTIFAPPPALHGEKLVARAGPSSTGQGLARTETRRRRETQ